MINPCASVVIASHRPGHIRSCVESVAACATAGNSFEIIVVADYDLSTVSGLDDLQKSNPHFNLMLIHHPHRSISAKRNIGIKHATAAIIGFTDDDCRVDPGWISAALALFAAHPEYAGVEGKTRLPKSDTNAATPFREFKRLERKQGYRTNNIFYLLKNLREIGGFDERFTVQREDVDCAYTLLDRGLIIGYDESIVVNHVLRMNERFDLLKNCWNRRFDPLLHAKHPRLYRQHIGTPWTPSIALIGVLHILLFGVIFLPQAGMVVGIVDAGTIALFSMRRNGFLINKCHQMVLDGMLFLVSPVILAFALIWGNIKFKNFFIA